MQGNAFGGCKCRSVSFEQQPKIKILVNYFKLNSTLLVTALYILIEQACIAAVTPKY